MFEFLSDALHALFDHATTAADLHSAAIDHASTLADLHSAASDHAQAAADLHSAAIDHASTAASSAHDQLPTLATTTMGIQAEKHIWRPNDCMKTKRPLRPPNGRSTMRRGLLRTRSR